MSYFTNKYPYTDFHELNLDWLLKAFKELSEEWDVFKVMNTITIAGLWDISKNYPQWAIVEDNGTGYLAIKPVPSGIDIHNTDYWMPIGAYSSVISDLATRLSALESRLTSDENTISNHTSQISNLGTRITNINNDLTDRIKKVDTLNGTILLIGDSYLQGYSPDGNVTSWGDRLSTFLNRPVKKYASGGAGFVAVGQNSKRFEDLIQDAINDSSVTNNDVTLIVIGGGWNDAAANASSADISSRMQNCKTKIDAAFPYAKTVVAFIGAGQYPESTVTYDKYYYTIERYAYGAAYAGFAYLDNIGMALKGTTNMLSSDGIHPNDMGNQAIALGIANYLRNGTSIITRQVFNAPNSDNIYTLVDEYTLLINHFNSNIYQVSIPSILCSGTNEVYQIDLSGHGIKPLMAAQYTHLQSTGQLTAGGKYYKVDVDMMIDYNGICHMRPYAIADDHTNYLSLTNVTHFVSNPYMITLPRRFV